jgi:GTPase SAR1 family protein
MNDEDFHHTVIHNGSAMNLAIVDMSGQDVDGSFDSLVENAKVFILVYDVTSPQTFRDIDQYRQYIHHKFSDLLQQHHPTLHITPEDACLGPSKAPAALAQKLIPMVMVANKCDDVAGRQVDREAGEQLAALYGNIPYVECSALAGDGCAEVFRQAVRVLCEADEYLRLPSAGAGSNKQNQNKKKKYCSIQ